MEVGPSRLEGDGLDLLHRGGTQSALHRLLGTYCAQVLGGWGEAPHGDGEGCRDESAYRLMKGKARTQNGVESILCSAKEISCLQCEREIREGFQEELGKGCGHRQSWERAPQDADAAVKAPTGKRRLDSGDTSHPVWLKGGR